MPDTTHTKPYRIGERVRGRLDKILPYGAFACLDDGTEAYLKRREISWDAEIDPYKALTIGQEIEAEVSELAGEGRLLEISIKAILPDPWIDASKKYRVGDVVQGTVRNVMPFGVFVVIQPCVQGFIPNSELALARIENPGGLLWKDDQVEAVITEIEHNTRNLRLSIKQRIQRQKKAIQFLEMFEHQTENEVAVGTPTVSTKESSDQELQWHLHTAEIVERVGKILIVDDHESVSGPLVAWLHKRHYEALTVSTMNEAIAQLDVQKFGLIFVDIDLAGADGLMLVQQIKDTSPATLVVIMSTNESLRNRATEIEKLEVITVFSKPLDVAEIEQLLLRIGRGESLAPQRFEPQTAVGPERQQPFRGLIAEQTSSSALADQLRNGLTYLCEVAFAEKGVVFHIDPDSKVVTILAESGRMPLRKAALFSLTDSPVNDVIVEKRDIFENNVSFRAQKRFEKLLAVLSFESCIGIPIDVQGETYHALFLFDRRPDAFNAVHQEHAAAMAMLVAAWLERDSVDKRIYALNPLLLSGQLAAGFGHELYNRMTGLELQLLNLQTDCDRADQDIPELSRSKQYQNMKQAVQNILDTSQDLRETVKLFQRLMRAEEEGWFDVNETLGHALALMRPQAKKHKIAIETRFEPNMPQVRGSSIRLQQVCLNIILNAIQHIELQSEEGRFLHIETECQTSDDGQWLQIRITDSGSGIHRQLWEKIFALGFTTRPTGSGLGLYIARGLLSTLGGNIKIERSYISLGTTFLIELPVSR